MGPASHRETINDHFSDLNYKKVIGLGESQAIMHGVVAVDNMDFNQVLLFCNK